MRLVRPPIWPIGGWSSRARQSIFFTEYGVPDTLDGRFELICLHAFLYLHRLKAERPRANRLCQSFFDRMFADFDRALREMGVGDLSVGKQVKRMARAFYGRIRAYEEGLAGNEAALRAALARNLFGTVSDPAPFRLCDGALCPRRGRGMSRQSDAGFARRPHFVRVSRSPARRRAVASMRPR